jgi:long-chain acyl-CoA synthetase
MPPLVAIEALLDKAAENWAPKIAIDFCDRTLTFAELHDLAIRAAKGLQALGVGPGVNVGLHLPNTPPLRRLLFRRADGGRTVSLRRRPPSRISSFRRV